MLESTSHNVLIITYWAFDDALIQSYTLPYVRIIKSMLKPGSTVFLATQEPNQLTMEKIASISDPDFITKPSLYQPFTLKTIFKLKILIKILSRFIDEHEIQTIHAWCSPAGAIGYLLHKKTGKRLVIDSFEPHAESLIENGTWKPSGLAFKILRHYEKKQANAAEHLIALTNSMKDYARTKYNCKNPNFHVKPAAVNLELFDRSKYPSIKKELGIKPHTIVCIYAGKIGGIYLEDEVFVFWKHCSLIFEDFKVIFLSNYSNNEFQQKLKLHGLDESTVIKKFVPYSEVPKYMAQADFAINPVKPVPTKRHCTSIKDGEYWAMGLPVVITKDISDDSALISNTNLGVVIENYNEEGLKKAALKIKDMLLSEVDHADRIRSLAIRYRNIESQKSIYELIYSKNNQG